MSLITLVYISSAVTLFSDDDLAALLATSRSNNTRKDITGMLAYRDGNFMQVLEGEEEPVLALEGIIGQDPRHTGMQRLIKSAIPERAFGSWSMGFKNTTGLAEANEPGYIPFWNMPLTDLEFANDPSKAQKLLLSFRQSMR